MMPQEVESEVQKLEERIGHKLPMTYRAFLIATNGAYTGHKKFLIPKDGKYDSIDYFYGFYPEHRHRHLPLKIASTDGECIIGVGCDPFGNEIRLGISGDDAGNIYFWNHETNSLQFLASDWDEFVKSTRQSSLEGIMRKHKEEGGFEQCIKTNDIATLKALIDSGESIDAVCGDFSDLPIEIALQCGNEDAARILLKGGAILTQESLFKFYVRKDVAALKLAIRYGMDVNTCINRIESPLVFIAIYSGNLDLLQWFLSHGADPNSRNGDGLSLFDAAQQCFLEDGRQEKHRIIIEFLREQGLCRVAGF